MKKILSILLLASLSPTLHAFNPKNTYISGSFLLGEHKNPSFSSSDSDFSLTPNLRTSKGFSSSIGYILKQWRFELQYLFQRADIKNANLQETSNTFHGNYDSIKGSLKQHAIMANIYYNHDFNRHFSAYIGSGIGISFQNYQRSEFIPHGAASAKPLNDAHDHATALAYQALTGLECHLSDHITLFLGYRFFLADNAFKESQLHTDTNLSSTSKHLPRSHNLESGIRFRF